MKVNRLFATLLLVIAATALAPETADAQRRVPSRRVAVARPRAIIVGRASPYYYNPWFRYPYGWYGAGAFGAGWYGAGAFGGWYGPGWSGGPFGYGQGGFYNRASVRIHVSPRTAEVFVDGYYAGQVDQFDGTFQRLNIEPGEHEITVYADGYQTLRQRLYLQPTGNTVTIRQDLEPLQPGEVQDPRPAPTNAVQSRTPSQPPRQQRRSGATPPSNVVVPERDQDPPPPPDRQADASFGVLSVRVQPGGASVVIDGERWDGPDGDERLLVQLSVGSHRVEIRRNGYRSFERTLEVRAGDTETLNVSLTRE